MDLQFKDRSFGRGLTHGIFALLAGAIGGLAQAPTSWWGVLFVSLPLLVWLLDQAHRECAAGRRMRAFFAIGWWWGFGYLGSSLWWVGNALLVDAEQFAWALPFAMVGLPAGLALFYGLGTLAALYFWRADTAADSHDLGGQAGAPFSRKRLIGLAVGFALADWVRGHILTGFPWNSLYQSLGGTDQMMQFASIGGPWALGFLITLAALMPATLFGRSLASRPTIIAALVGLMITGGLFAYGTWRLNHATLQDSGVTVHIVQPNIAQRDKWNRALLPQHMETLLTLSAPPPDPRSTIVIWPEVAVPYDLTNEPGLRAEIGETIGLGNLLITGAFEFDRIPGAATDIYNGISILDGTGRIIDTYRKHHLVPFGEYLPLKAVLSAIGLKKLTEGIGDLAAGHGPQTLALQTGDGRAIPAFGPQICYEAIFPHQQTAANGPRPQWLVNVTNDAWYGDTPGPRQHLVQARFRAIEQGLPLARAANTGISALIDPYGRIIGQHALNNQGVITEPLPTALSVTIYARVGDSLFWLLLVLGGLSAAKWQRRAT